MTVVHRHCIMSHRDNWSLFDKFCCVMLNVQDLNHWLLHKKHCSRNCWVLSHLIIMIMISQSWTEPWVGFKFENIDGFCCRKTRWLVDSYDVVLSQLWEYLYHYRCRHDLYLSMYLVDHRHWSNLPPFAFISIIVAKIPSRHDTVISGIAIQTSILLQFND